MEGYLTQPRFGGRGIGSGLSFMTDFVDSPWEVSPSEEWMGDGVGRRWEEGEDRRERELRLVCKIRLF